MTTTPAPSITAHDLVGTATGPFATTWRYADPGDVVVILATGTGRRVLSSGAGDYTLTAAAPLTSGGSVTLSVAVVPFAGWSAGDRVLLKRRTTRRQATALPDTEGHKPRATARALDKAMLIAEEDRDDIGRALLMPVGQVGGEVPWSPGAGERFLTLDSEGRPRAVERPEDFDGLNKLNRDGSGMADGFQDVAKRFNIIVRNTPFGFGAVGNDPVRDTAAVNQMIADGVRTIYAPGSIHLAALAMVDDLVIEMATGAEIIRPAQATGTQWITAAGKRGFRILGGVLNGSGELTANPHNILSLLSGCSNFEIDGVTFQNPKRIGGSWGGGLTIADTADIALGTSSRVANLKMSCPTDDKGSYAVVIYRSGALQIRDLVARHFFNGALAINDPTVPVPQNVLNQMLIDVIGVFDTDCGGGVFVFGSREGVDAYGDVLGHNVISGRMNISHCVSVRPSTYGHFIQGRGINSTNIMVVDGTCEPEDLYGGILFDGGTLSNFTVINAPGIALELGGSTRTRATGGSIRGDSIIGINTGASLYAEASRITLDGPQTGVLASGFDGADGSNWFKDRGRGLVLKDIDYYAYASTDRALVGSNGFQRIEIGSFRSHIRHAGAKGLTFDLSGADDVIWTDDGSCEVDETASNLTNHSSRVEVASAAEIVVPDHARVVTVTGTTTVNTIRLRSQVTMDGGIRAVIANAGSFGDGYVPGTAMTIIGDGADALVIPVISGGDALGGYVVAKGYGYSAATAEADTGTGAVFSVAVGPSQMVDHRLSLTFTGACPVGNGVGNVYSGGYTAPGFGLGVLPLLGNYNNFQKVGL